MDATDVIDRLPYEFQARLEADEYFADVPVIVAEDGDVEAELRRKTASITSKGGKRGVAVLVLPTLANDEHPNVLFGPLTFFPGFQVVENVSLNRDANGTKKPARRVAKRIVHVIKSGLMAHIIADLRPDNPCIAAAEVEGLKVVEVNFRCLEVIDERPVQVALPLFSVVNGEVTISCATEGASVYYTVTEDEEGDAPGYPRATNPNAVLYTGGIAIPAAGMHVRACGYKEGCIASAVNAWRVPGT